MRLVAVSPFLAFPGVGHAGGDFLFRHLERQRRDHRVRLVALSTPDNEQALHRLPDAGPLLALPDVAARSGRWRRRLVSSLRWNLLAASPEQFESMLSPVAAELGAAEVVEVHWAGWFADLIPALRRLAPQAVLAAYPYDVPWQADASRAALLAQSPSGRAGIWRERVSSSAFRLFEARRLGAAELVVVLTRRDLASMEAAGLAGAVVLADPHLEGPVDGALDRRASRPPGANVVFTADFGRLENHLGALWLLDEVWPAVRRRLPDATLVLAGARPPDALLARAGEDVQVTGYRESLAPCYEGADVFVAPVMAGGGLKFKVATALLYGLPVVATPIAAEGVIEEAGPEVFGAIASDASAMADGIASLLEDPGRARAVGERARAWASRRWDFEASETRLSALYVALARRG